MTNSTKEIINHQLREALLSRRIDGVFDEEIVRRLVRQGMTEANANEIVSMVISQALRSERRLFRKVRKLESILDIKRLHDKLSRRPRMVPEVHKISEDEFLESYYSKNLPVLLLGACKHWRASEWTINHLEERFRGKLVEVMSDREADSRFELNRDEHKQLVPFDVFAERLRSPVPSDDWYMVAHNHALEGQLASLIDDMAPIPGVLGTPQASHMNLWIGPAGTKTRLHHDSTNVLLVQVMGRKTVILAPSMELHLLQNDVGGYSEVIDPRRIPQSAPQAHLATFMEVELRAGDALFVPMCWWHYVESKEMSISVSCSNFIHPNSFPLYNP